MYPRVRTISVNPRLERWETRWAMDGMFTMGMQGLGRSKVRGLSRVPSPPHMMQTFIEEYGAAGFLRVAGGLRPG
jgi:hypothetical protein